MSTFASAKELKYRAKYHMVGRFGVAINALITIQLFLTGLTILINLVCDRATVPGLILFYLLQIMVTILSALFASGHCYLYLNICCNRPVDGSMIYYGFKNQPEFHFSLAQPLHRNPGIQPETAVHGYNDAQVFLPGAAADKEPAHNVS